MARYLAQYGPYSDAVLSDVLLQRSLSELYYLATELPVPSYDTGCICCSANGPSTHVAGCAYKAYENYT